MLTAIRSIVLLDSNVKVTHTSISIATVNIFLLFTAAYESTIKMECIVAFTSQRSFRERGAMLRYTYICLFC